MEQQAAGDASDAAQGEALWSALYPDLKRLARARMRRAGPNMLLETTGLVHEVYLRAGDSKALQGASRGAFMAYAARAMRNVVVDLVRESRALCRGGDMAQVTLNTAVMEGMPPAPDAEDEPLRIDDALRALAEVEPRLCQVVEMRYFSGLPEAEIAASLGVTERTVRRDWAKATMLLRTLLKKSAG